MVGNICFIAKGYWQYSCCDVAKKTEEQSVLSFDANF